MKPSLFSNLHTSFARAGIALAVVCSSFWGAQAQITVSQNQTAAALATALTGSGVIVLAPVLTCDTGANGRFTTTGFDPVGVSAGIVLTSGSANAIAAPASTFESVGHTPSLSDADLATLAGGTTNDACVLEFDFKAAGDTVRFNYVFASEEYPEFACSGFNDVFGFLISGGVTAPGTSYPTPYNIARVPGTNIPVCINSVNSAPTGTSYGIAGCTSLGPGSPFNMYYVDNSASTMLVYDGKTTVLTAVAGVSPCDTYHLKLGIADVGDNAYNSGVFIQGGSLTSTVPTTITAVGTSGLPYCIRGCNPGNFIFSIPEAQDTNVTVHYNIIGTAVNGYDYTWIADSVIIPATATSTVLDILPLLVPAAGPKVVTLEILKEDPCHPGVFTPVTTASLTILDSFNFHIITPDTSICAGQYVEIHATGDPDFATVLDYNWTPLPVSDDTALITIVTPVVTTTYSLTVTADPALGCIPQTKTITVSIYPNPVLTVDSAIVNTCVGTPVPLNVYVSPAGTAYTYIWSPATYLSSTSIPNPTSSPTAVGDVGYTVTVYPTALPACESSTNITVHVVPNDFVLNNRDTAICIGESVQVSIVGWPEFIWRWTPPTGVSDPNIMEPVITTTNNGTYTVTASYAHCPDMVHSFYIEVDTPATQVTLFDTICIPMTYSVDLTVPGSTGVGNGYYHYQWSPATYLSNDTIPNPLISPVMGGAHNYTVTVQPHAASCAVDDYINIYVLPNTINLMPDTAICKGRSVQIVATGDPLFEYQWLPTAGIPVSNVLAPLITPDTSALYKVRVSFHLCPAFYDSLVIDVQPNPEVYIGGSKFVCEADTIRLISSVTPGWYDHYIYNWTPATHIDKPNDNVAVLTGVSNETIILTVTTPAGCIGMDSAQIRVLPGNFASIVPELDFCPHETAVLTPEGGVSYQWAPPLYLSGANEATPVIAPITDQAYSIVATSADGCKDTIYFKAVVHAGAVIFLEDSVTLHPGETYQILPETNCTSVSWSPSGGLSGKYIIDPVASPAISTKYVVTGITEYGCKTKDSININVTDETLITLPNAFTPGSGANNEFKIIKRGIATLDYFRIFNRWGNVVFETTNIDEGWDGTYKGVTQPVGVYVYMVTGKAKSGKIFRKQGNVTLLR
jgi:gliding motility-associated-like protein